MPLPPMTPITIYMIGSGEIIDSGTITFLPDLKHQQITAALMPWGLDTHALMEGYSEKNSDYVVLLNGEPTVTKRPPLLVEIDTTTLTAGSGDFATLTGLPDPCQIIIDDPDPTVETIVAEVTGGGFEFEATTPGVYVIEVRRFPFLPWRVEVTAS